MKNKRKPARIRQIICAQCGSRVPSDESLGAQVSPNGHWAEVCRDCYDDIVQTCQLCGDDDVMPIDLSEFILLKTELAGTGQRPPGIYQVLHRPFLLIPLIGSGSLCSHDVLFVDRLPSPDDTYKTSGWICRSCAKPYQVIFRRAYRRSTSWLCGHRWTQGQLLSTWDLERAHTRATILAHPDMLRDLECDPSDETYADPDHWRALQELYDLPDGLLTYHEWLLLSHRGVRVYSTRSRTDEQGDGWLALRPEPRFRAGAGALPETFSASSLPTYPSWDSTAPENQSAYHNPYDWDRTHSLPAIRDAIDFGYLTQTRVKVRRR